MYILVNNQLKFNSLNILLIVSSTLFFIFSIGSVHFIDYEFAMYNYEHYEIASHFCESGKMSKTHRQTNY